MPAAASELPLVLTRPQLFSFRLPAVRPSRLCAPISFYPKAPAASSTQQTAGKAGPQPRLLHTTPDSAVLCLFLCASIWSTQSGLGLRYMPLRMLNVLSRWTVRGMIQSRFVPVAAWDTAKPLSAMTARTKGTKAKTNHRCRDVYPPFSRIQSSDLPLGRRGY